MPKPAKKRAAQPSDAPAPTYTEITHQNVMLLAAMSQITPRTARRAMLGKWLRSAYDRDRVAEAARKLAFTLPPAVKEDWPR